MSTALILAAPAKLNLYLHVTGRRPDGDHTIESLVAFAGLADRLEFADAPAGTFEIAVAGPFATALAGGEADNLALRAARALAATVGNAEGCRIRLTKEIPVAAGLGGGSADAAAALVGLARLWGLGSVPLAGIAAGLGADVPVCLAARPAHVGGIGEALSPAPALPEAGLVLVNPGVALATAGVFAAFDRLAGAGARRRRPAPPLREPPADAAALAAALAATGNDLTAAAQSLAPAVGEALDVLAGAPGALMARMAGSGATCFALFADGAGAARAAREIAAAAPGWWVWAGALAAGREGPGAG